MDQEDSSEESQGSAKSVKGKRGIIWGNAETSALLKVWGEAEIKYALSSLKRNYEIFEMISSELLKIGYQRSTDECRTKTKSLRKLYKQAVLHNNTSGSGRSKFIWFDEMAQIFRTDTSIHPLRTTESESATDTAEAMEGDGDEIFTLELFESNEFLPSASSDVSATGNQSTDECDPSTSGCSSSLSTATSRSDTLKSKGKRVHGREFILKVSELPAHNLNRQLDLRNDVHNQAIYAVETTNYEATLDPATRLAMLCKRKQRATAAARLDNTLSGFVAWVQKNAASKEEKSNAQDEEKRFHNEVISNLKVASTSLMRLTDYITSSNCSCNGDPCAKLGSVHMDNTPNNCSSGHTNTLPAGKCNAVGTSKASSTDSEIDLVVIQPSDNETDSDLDRDTSQSLLGTDNEVQTGSAADILPRSTPTGVQKRKKGKTGIENITCSVPIQTSSGTATTAEPSASPYLIIKEESEGGQGSQLRTPVKRIRKKRQVFTP